MRDLARARLERAQGDDAAAARLSLSYLVGRPADAADPDRLDADEFAKRSERPTPLDHTLLNLRG